MSRVRITSTGTPAGTKVYVDGVDISSTVTRIEWTVDARDQVALAHLTLNAFDLEADVEADEVVDAEVVA